MIRVLVVDDSATMRSLIAAVLSRDPEIEVVGQAGDPLEARDAIKALNPDVITLDVEMPNMNGIDFLERIMRLRPMPVVMVSTLTVRGAEVTLEALELGAVDCVAKPSTGGLEGFQELPEKVKTAARAKVRPLPPRGAAPPQPLQHTADGRVVAIGSSTGGVEALIAVLGRFPANCPATVITQHMPAAFTKSFADRLDRLCAPKVEEAYDGAPLAAGRVYVAAGGACHLEVVGAAQLRCRVQPGEPVNGHRPSVDVLFRSVARTVGRRGVGLILTGMGRDGAQGLLEMRQAGAHTLGQDEASCVVYGMPKAAFEIGAVERQAPLDRLAGELLKTSGPTKLERA
ncbi:chemotaxis response regulator protein-glutamate methylesterase [Phenylobacterium hankyongense]|uniref:Protein-glutamate methylesterase/protein-glutamine glutaminase n=1 Tax=Phenylobacterium hankyongense TaxID=1813876 RepID=A0A328AXR9_9CAUL|nr:chemotaxis response regulator protein-glutamate methylesterase [Phenylobacterium hankyongense]RAK59449.1 chemotaxis response regulator protein-glutamate methylesterase [Phenylobacterium hankyongense]